MTNGPDGTIRKLRSAGRVNLYGENNLTQPVTTLECQYDQWKMGTQDLIEDPYETTSECIVLRDKMPPYSTIKVTIHPGDAENLSAYGRSLGLLHACNIYCRDDTLTQASNLRFERRLFVK